MISRPSTGIGRTGARAGGSSSSNSKLYLSSRGPVDERACRQLIKEEIEQERGAVQVSTQRNEISNIYLYWKICTTCCGDGVLRCVVIRTYV